MIARQDGREQGTLENTLGTIKYEISVKRAEYLQRSVRQIILDRMCTKCSELVESKGSVPTVGKQIKMVADCCAKLEGFIQGEFTLQDILFRTLLSESNRPMSLVDLHRVITEQWATPVRPMDISIQSLKHILDSDVYYCFSQSA